MGVVGMEIEYILAWYYDSCVFYDLIFMASRLHRERRMWMWMVVMLQMLVRIEVM